MKTPEIFTNLNTKLKATLLKSITKDLPIYGNSFLDPFDIAFDNPAELSLKTNKTK